jgi:hypothetical protein
MRWIEVREQFPNEWVVLEVIKAHSKDGNRYIEEVVVINRFEKSVQAMLRYDELRKEKPNCEYCFFHTSRPNLVARERYVGIRGSR